MKLDYKFVNQQWENGKTYREIWEDMKLPCKYTTFESAAIRYKKTGKERQIMDLAKYIEPKEIVDDLNCYSIPADSIKVGIVDGGFRLDGIQEELNLDEYKSKEEVLDMLKKGCKLKDIGPDPIKSTDILDELIADGYCVEFKGGLFKLTTNLEKKNNVIHRDWNGCKHIRVGVVSDTHIGNVCNQITFLNHLYDRYEEMGITDVYHCGDVSDGWYPNRSDQVYELHSHGADRQVDYIAKRYPKKDGITTHFIVGNHDYTFIRNTGFNIGPAIASKRPDMNYLGINNAKVYLTPNCIMELNHPADGSAYAMSYSIQKYIDSMSGGDKPNILLNGHHHKYLTMFYRNIHAIEVPCVEAQTNFMKSKRLAAHMGGLVLDIYVDDEGTIDRFNVELIPLYKALENDY